jgi:hypothetical protein
MKLRTLRPRVAVANLTKLTPPKKQADAIYLDPRWRKLIASIIAERGRRCELCGKSMEDDGSPVRLIGDHVEELKDGGEPFDRSNVKLNCTRTGGNGRPHADGKRGGCHNRKTIEARSARLRQGG